MPPLPRDLGPKVLTGAAGPLGQARAERIRTILRNVIGPEGASAAAVPDLRTPEKAKLFPLRGNARARTEAIKVAAGVAEAFLSRELEKLTPHVHPSLWMLWPDGKLARHSAPLLIDALAKRPGGPASLIIEDKQIYTASEMRSIVPRGITEAVERMLEVQNPTFVTFGLEAKTGRAGVALVVMSPDKEGKWRAHNLLLPAIDEAHRESRAVSASEDEAIRFADRIVRHYVLGHDRHLKALRNHFFERVYFGEEVLAPEQIVELAAKGSHRMEALDVVFGGTKLGGELPASLKKKAKEIWGRPLEKLKLKVVQTIAGEKEIASVMLEVKGRWRLGALIGA